MATIHRLANGITCVCEERPDLDVVRVKISIKKGSSDEADDEAGLTFLTQEACNGGTKTRSRFDIINAIDAKGAHISTDSGRIHTEFEATSLAKDSRYVFEILSDLVRNPAFDANEVRKTQAQIIQYITQKNQRPDNRQSNYYMEALFGDQPIAKPHMGTQDLVTSYTPDQLRIQHAKLLSDPSKIIISFAGNIDSATASKLVKDYFGDLSPAASPKVSKDANFTGGDLREPASIEQLSLTIGFPAARFNDSERYSYLMLQQLLSGGMSSPLFQEIREKRGLVYHVSANYSNIQTQGLFSVSAGTGKGQAFELLTTTMDLLGDFIRRDIPTSELDRARKQMLRQMECSMESSSAVSSRNISQLENFGRITSLEELNDKLSQTTSDSIRLACLDMLKDGRYAFSGVGPLDTIPPENEIRAMMQKQVKNAPVLKPVTISSSLSTSAPAFADAQKKVAIAAQPPQMTTLPNGIRVVTATRPGSLSTGAWTGVGSDCETAAQNGASHMIEHMMFKGTKSYAPGSIDRIIEMDLLGALNAYTSKDQTAYYFYNMASEDLEKIIDICGEMVFEATIGENEYEGEKITLPDGSPGQNKGERDVVYEEIKQYEVDLGDRLRCLLDETAYPNQSHGRPIIGTAATLGALSAQDLRDYRDAAYVPNNTIFVAVGQVAHKDFVELIERKYGHLKAGPGLPLPTPHYVGGTQYREIVSARECRISLVAEAVERTHPDYYAYDILSDILGSGQSSRLYKKIVDELELTNGIGASVHGQRNCGAMYISSSAPADKVRDIINTAYAELRKLAADVTQDELASAIIKNEMPLELRGEINKNACRAYAVDTLVFGAPQSSKDIIEKARAVTIDDLKAVARRVLTSNPTVAMLVPPGTDPALLPSHDEVLAMRDGTWTPAPSAQAKPQAQAAPQPA